MDAIHSLGNYDTPVHIFTDHRNLAYIFDSTYSASGRRVLSDKLVRWSLKLRVHDYIIEHISGSSNIWADLLSRWNSTGNVKAKYSKIIVHSDFLEMESDAEWPSRKNSSEFSLMKFHKVW
jgi:hypothetical protein